MSLDQKLLTTPVNQWSVRQAVVFDWYDGPREGVCSLVSPEGEFLFELLAERPNDEDLDDRLFLVWELPPGTVDTLVQNLRVLGEPTQLVWVPVWRFANRDERIHAEASVQTIRGAAKAPSVVIATRDMERFLDCWRAAPPQRGGPTWPALSEVVPPVSIP
jgi:hypothetical protein